MKSRILFIIALAVAFAGSARGYVLEGQRWPDGSVVLLQVGLGDAGRTLADGNTSWNTAVAPVPGLWNQEMLRMQFSPSITSSSSASSGDHVNSVVFANNVFGQPFGGNTLAVTYYRYSGSTISESDTLLNRAVTFDSYRGPLRYPPGGGYSIPDIRRVFLHELGHTLGLDHPDTAGQHVVAVMNSIINNQEVPSADDIAGAQSIYGAGVGATPAPTPGQGQASHLANISTRMRVGVGPDVLIGGLIVEGTESKKLILRAIGPSLAASGVSNAISDPMLELHSSTGIIASNDDWISSSQASEIASSGFAPENELESAVIVTVAPGSYTAVVNGWQGAQGVGLVEAYELDSNDTRLVNISTRGQVGVANDVMIGGLIVQGTNAKHVIVRAIGPSLSGIAGVLSDPTLELRDNSGNLIASNDDWNTSPQAAEIIATGVPPPDNRESAVIATCGAGNYTAIVQGANNATGVALVEVYDLDQ